MKPICYTVLRTVCRVICCQVYFYQPTWDYQLPYMYTGTVASYGTVPSTTGFGVLKTSFRTCRYFFQIRMRGPIIMIYGYERLINYGSGRIQTGHFCGHWNKYIGKCRTGRQSLNFNKILNLIWNFFFLVFCKLVRIRRPMNNEYRIPDPEHWQKMRPLSGKPTLSSAKLGTFLRLPLMILETVCSKSSSVVRVPANFKILTLSSPAVKQMQSLFLFLLKSGVNLWCDTF